MRWFDMDRKPSLEIQLDLRHAFLADGFRELSMDGIAQACGLTRRSLYFCFSNKEEVFRAAISFLNEDNAARVGGGKGAAGEGRERDRRSDRNPSRQIRRVPARAERLAACG